MQANQCFKDPAAKDFSTQSYCARVAHRLAPEPRRVHVFHVDPPHDIREPHLNRHCRWAEWPDAYDCSVHWFWQTQWDTHMWVPEIYQGLKMPISITREVPQEELYRIVGENHKGYDKQLSYLHFDFEVEARVRELGYGSNFFRRGSKPPDIRAKHDSGQPIGSDMSAFCLYCTFSNFERWPTKPTQDFDQAARAWVRKVGSPLAYFRHSAD